MLLFPGKPFTSHIQILNTSNSYKENLMGLFSFFRKRKEKKELLKESMLILMRIYNTKREELTETERDSYIKALDNVVNVMVNL
jgi:hypothetical protein